jgi:hypothetical protein
MWKSCFFVSLLYLLLSDLFCLFQGARVWIRHPERVWEGAEVVSDYKGATIKVQSEDGTVS